jgi:predicted transcriptional regulator
MKPMSPQQAIQRLTERDWKPIQIAAAIGVSKSTISRIQNGLVDPTYAVRERLWGLVSSRKGPATYLRGMLNGNAESAPQ